MPIVMKPAVRAVQACSREKRGILRCEQMLVVPVCSDSADRHRDLESAYGRHRLAVGRASNAVVPNSLRAIAPSYPPVLLRTRMNKAAGAS